MSTLSTLFTANHPSGLDAAIRLIRAGTIRLAVTCFGLTLALCWLGLAYVGIERSWETVTAGGGLTALSGWGLPHLLAYLAWGIIGLIEFRASVIVLVFGSTQRTDAGESEDSWQFRLNRSCLTWLIVALVIGVFQTFAILITHGTTLFEPWAFGPEFDFSGRVFLQMSAWHLLVLVLLSVVEGLWHLLQQLIRLPEDA